MLLRFSAENHLSLRDQTELSLVSSNLKDFEGGVIEHEAASGYKILPSAIIYGANASGKTNIISAMNRMFGFVVGSHYSGRPDQKMSRFPFLLDEEYSKKATTFEADFISDGNRYIYGFSYFDNFVSREWLYSFNSNRSHLLFEREESRFKFGRRLKGRNQTIADLTRRNSLFVSAAAQNDHGELSSVYRFFSEAQFHRTIAVPSYTASKEFADGEIDERVLNFLRNIGSGVIGYRRLEEEVSEQSLEFSRGMAQLLERLSGEPIPQDFMPSTKAVAIELAHLSKNGEKIYFDLDRESAGTRRLLIILNPIFKILDSGGLIVVDEFDASLHTQVCEAILALFSSSDYNKSGAQIIATTHDTNILSAGFLRRDQVWFCEKDEEGSTNLFPLTDIKLRSTDNIERGYLQGRFGALPFRGTGAHFVQRGGVE